MSTSIADVVGHGQFGADRSVAEHLRRGALAIRRRSSKDWQLPGYENLFVTFRALKDYREVHDEFERAFAGRTLDAAETDIQTAIIQLLLSSVNSYAIVDGERREIGLPLGLELYDYIWPAESEDEARPQTDAEALIMLFDDNTVQITTLALQIDRWFADVNAKADGELLGN